MLSKFRSADGLDVTGKLCATFPVYEPSKVISPRKLLCFNGWGFIHSLYLTAGLVRLYDTFQHPMANKLNGDRRNQCEVVRSEIKALLKSF